jgi:membrane-bound serine protease (ClpP class)
LIAEAMVDPDVEVEGVVGAGKLLTLTTREALDLAVADARAGDLAGAVAALGREGAELRHARMNWAERVVRFLTQPLVASALMTLGMLGLVVELRTPGFGVPGLVGLVSFVAFFWGHALVHLVGWEQLALIGGGILLLSLELLVIPGFGVAGILGIIALAMGLGTSLIGEGASLAAVASAITRVVLSGALALAASLVAFLYLPRLPGGQRLVLGAALGARSPRSAEPAAPPQSPLVGVRGTALTPLRPAGIAAIDGQRMDVVSSGEFIAAGVEVEVALDDGLRVVVQQVRKPSAREGTA